MTLRVKLAKNLNGCFPIFSVYQRKQGGAFQFSIKCPKQTETSYFEKTWRRIRIVGHGPCRSAKIYEYFTHRDILEALAERWQKWQRDNCQGCENTISPHKEGEG